ncbi:DUF4286 family protein [Zunongwangia endophytica]|uniref:DUF4286 family protein n=1 Tax=Zunongwangia endophytica TaxID=1808945 RepID=A0ABV8H576_9FLAO|nr:DUF4286 family protein [Zunongwangia endophytica]MDN3596163.1 DUF4286 family protein [Zunongwangia endophytica]
MVIYNVTTNVQEDVHQEWLKWMKSEFIPAMLKTGKFKKALMTKVLAKEPMGGITYSVQYTAESMAYLKTFYMEDHAKMVAKTEPFKGKFVEFSTELQVEDEQ